MEKLLYGLTPRKEILQKIESIKLDDLWKVNTQTILEKENFRCANILDPHKNKINTSIFSYALSWVIYNPKKTMFGLMAFFASPGFLTKVTPLLALRLGMPTVTSIYSYINDRFINFFHLVKEDLKKNTPIYLELQAIPIRRIDGKIQEIQKRLYNRLFSMVLCGVACATAAETLSSIEHIKFNRREGRLPPFI